MKNAKIIKQLCLSYAMELETVQNYIAASVNLDGVRSEVIKKALAADIAVEVQHAQQLATRIKTIGGLVPGSLDLPRSQKFLQPRKDTTDIVAVIKGAASPDLDPEADLDIATTDEELACMGGLEATDRVDVQPWLESEGRFSFVSSDPKVTDLVGWEQLISTK